MRIKNGDIMIADLDKVESKIKFTLKEKEKEASEV
jgi:hypothetical protein